MLQRSPIALTQVKAGDLSENLLNEICQTKLYMLILGKRNYWKSI